MFSSLLIAVYIILTEIRYRALLINTLFFLILQPDEKIARRYIITHYLLPGTACKGIGQNIVPGADNRRNTRNRKRHRRAGKNKARETGNHL